MFAKVWLGNSATQCTLDDLLVVDIGGMFAADSGVATSRLAGARAAGDSFIQTADAIVEFTVTTRQSAGNSSVYFRMVAASDALLLQWNAIGTVTLFTKIANGFTAIIASASGAIADGTRVVIRMTGAAVSIYLNDVLWTTQTISQWATATNGKLNALGTGAVVSEIIAWPRQVALPAGL
jgi:hypothetical protein